MKINRITRKLEVYRNYRYIDDGQDKFILEFKGVSNKEHLYRIKVQILLIKV